MQCKLRRTSFKANLCLWFLGFGAWGRSRHLHKQNLGSPWRGFKRCFLGCPSRGGHSQGKKGWFWCFEKGLEHLDKWSCRPSGAPPEDLYEGWCRWGWRFFFLVFVKLSFSRFSSPLFVILRFLPFFPLHKHSNPVWGDFRAESGIFKHFQAKSGISKQVGRTRRGSYSWKGVFPSSQCLLESLLRTPSKNPSQNPSSL